MRRRPFPSPLMIWLKRRRRTPADSTAPTLSSATTDATGLSTALVFDESVTGLLAADFALSTGQAVTDVSGSGDTWTLTHAQVYAGETPTLAYSGTAVEDAAGNALATFSGAAITNNSTVVAAFVHDTFAGTNGQNLTARTGEVGATWTRHTSYTAGFAIHNNAAHPNSTAACDYASGVPSGAEYDVVAEFLHQSSISGHQIGIAGRVSTAANTMYFVRHRQAATSVWELFKLVEGTATLLGSYSQNLVNGQSYAVKLELRDAAKKVYIDGVERISSADNEITAAGRVGLRGANSNNTGILITYLTATNA